MTRRARFIVVSLLVAGGAVAEEPVRTVTQAAGAPYRAGPLHRFFLGAHWRDAWTTPIEVPVLDLGTFDGGLRPLREGGSLQTTSLRFKSGNGRTWAFRSVDKDSTRALDPDTRASWIGDVAQDQTSAAYPVGALIVAPLLEAAGIVHATPQLFVLPDDPRLGKLRAFAGLLGLLEERIADRLEDEHEVVNTVKLFERLERRSDEHVDARVYLRARLVDMLVGDFDRHFDQWRWVRFDDGGERVWHPIPRDRDLAFTRYDGVVPSIALYYSSNVTTFSARYPPIDKLTFTGRFIDRRFLVALDRPDWEAVADDLAARLTDAVIADAVRRLPQALHAQDGDELERSLRARRDALPAAARELYRLLAEDVDVRGTVEGEDFELERKASGAVEVAVYVRDAATGERAGAPFFHRTFQPEETHEIRVYTLGGADRIVVGGATDRTIPVRVVAPGRGAAVDDRSSRPSALTVHEPIPDRPVEPADIALLGPKQAAAVAHYQPVRDWGRDVLVFPQLSYDSSRGLVLGAYVRRTAYDFQLVPRASVTRLGAAWSTGTNRPRVEYSADVQTRSPVRGLLYLAYSGMDQAKFFGFGNDTPRDSNLASEGFYDVTQGRVVADAMLDAALAGPLHGRVGARFKHAFGVDRSGTFATTRPRGAEGLSLLGGEAGLRLERRAGEFTSRRGISLDVSGRHTPSILGNHSAYSKLRGEVSGSVAKRVLTDVSLGLRLAGERNWGSYPWFDAAFIGGDPQRGGPLDLTGAYTGNLLRGYDLNRFAGDASLVANTELSVALGKTVSVVPLRYGLVALADIGRVFVDGESSSKWHTGYGGGLWLGVYASTLKFEFTQALKATVVRSEEGTRFYLMSAFAL